MSDWKVKKRKLTTFEPFQALIGNKIKTRATLHYSCALGSWKWSFQMVLSLLSNVRANFLHSAWFWIGLSSKNNHPQQAINRWPSQRFARGMFNLKKKNQTVHQAKPLIIICVGLSPSRVYTVNTDLLPLIPINIVGSSKRCIDIILRPGAPWRLGCRTAVCPVSHSAAQDCVWPRMCL